MVTRALITGGAGFIGHHVIGYLLANTDWDLTLIDRLDCSGNLNRLAEIGAAKNPRVRFVYHDLRGSANDQLCAQIGRHKHFVHLAAATHVDRSISDPMSFVQDNVVGTCNALELARRIAVERFLYFSTDEVFGPAPPGVAFRENDRYYSGNPYSATKAGGEELAMAYFNTYKLPVIVTHTMNVFGRRQHPEKFIPQTVGKVLRGETVTIHADATRALPGSRYYVHAEDVAEAVLLLLRKGTTGEKYNIVGAEEVDNLSLARMVALSVGRSLRYDMVDFHSSRPGHDLRYALDGAKMRDQLGWGPRSSFRDRLEETVAFTLQNQHWMDTHGA